MKIGLFYELYNKCCLRCTEIFDVSYYDYCDEEIDYCKFKKK